MLLTLDQIFQLETNLENGFEAILARCNVKIFRVRDTDAGISPRLEINVTVGDALNHQHLFPDNSWVTDAWNGVFDVTVVTNRTDTEARTQIHQRLIGLVRKYLQYYQATNNWLNTGPVILDTIHELGSVESFVDQNDLDNTKMSWSIMFNLNTAVVNQAAQSALQ